MHPRSRVHHARRGPPGDLQVDQLVQLQAAALEPRPHPTRNLGTAVPSSVITTRPPNGEMPTLHCRTSRADVFRIDLEVGQGLASPPLVEPGSVKNVLRMGRSS